MAFELDDTQKQAIEFLKKSVLAKEKTVALLGAGGTGKTAILHKLSLEKDLEETKITFTATTNKAASIMRKDIPDAITMHSAVSKFVPTKLFTEMEFYFENDGKSPTTLKDLVFSDDAEIFLKNKEQKAETILEDHKDVKDFFHHYEIDGYDPIVFSHYATAGYLGGVCVIDESSMLPTKSIYKKDDKTGKMKLQTIGLDIIQGIYDTVILVGDDSQLPPINGKSSFEGVPSHHLTKNYRSQKDLLRLLDYARNGGCLELFVPEKGESIRVVKSISKKMLEASFNQDLDIAHIVYKNKTRIDITKKIRGDNVAPFEGEPIVYYGQNINETDDSIAKNEMGKYEDGAGVWDNHREYIDFALFDEYPSNRPYSKYRYGYSLTAHSAQGSSFDHVVIHLYDIPGFIDVETQRKWLYTAVSRAKKSVTLVRGE